MFGATRGLLLGIMLAAACAHDDLVIAAREGPAPGQVERPGALRRHLRAHARALRRAPPGPPLFLPSGTPDIQRPHPAWAELVDGAQIGRPGGPPSDTAGPVKAHAQHLLLLHDQRLLVVTLADLRVVASEPLGDTFHPALLVHGDRVIVDTPRLPRGQGAAREELQQFTIAGDGRLTRGRSVHLRGAPSYSDGVTRVVGDTLVLYRQRRIGARTPDILGLPAIWRAGRWQPQVRAGALQRPIQQASGVHTVLRCELRDELECQASGVLAPSTIFVAFDDAAFFAWISGPSPAIWRLPIDGSPATAVRVTGRPQDLLTWRVDHGDLDAVVTTSTAADDRALVHVPGDMFRPGLDELPAAALQPLPRPLDIDAPARFIGGHLVHADAPDWACHGGSELHVRALADGATTRIAVPHCISRIEPLAGHALLIAAEHNRPEAPARLTVLDLGAAPTLGDTREYSDVQTWQLRADGPYRLGGAQIALPPEVDAPLRALQLDAPRWREPAAAKGRGQVAHAFAYAGRMFVIRDDALIELAVRDDALLELRRVPLTRAQAP